MWYLKPTIRGPGVLIVTELISFLPFSVGRARKWFSKDKMHWLITKASNWNPGLRGFYLFSLIFHLFLFVCLSVSPTPKTPRTSMSLLNCFISVWPTRECTDSKLLGFKLLEIVSHHVVMIPTQWIFRFTFFILCLPFGGITNLLLNFVGLLYKICT